MYKVLYSLCAFLFLINGFSFSQEITNKTPGLELPQNQIVNSDEGFVNIQATCKGTVKWLVISSERVKSLPNSATNSIIVSVPYQGGLITIYAVAVVDNKLTEFVSCNIVVNVISDKNNTTPKPTEPRPQEPLHVTFILDLNTVSQELAKTLNSPTLKKFIVDRGCYFRILDNKSPVVSAKKLDILINRVNGPALIIQKNDGSLAVPVRLIPNSEEEILNIIKSLR